LNFPRWCSAYGQEIGAPGGGWCDEGHKVRRFPSKKVQAPLRAPFRGGLTARPEVVKRQFIDALRPTLVAMALLSSAGDLFVNQ